MAEKTIQGERRRAWWRNHPPAFVAARAAGGSCRWCCTCRRGGRSRRAERAVRIAFAGAAHVVGGTLVALLAGVEHAVAALLQLAVEAAKAHRGSVVQAVVAPLAAADDAVSAA